MRRQRPGRVQDRSAFAGFRFPPEVITVAVRWYLRYGLSYRDVEELLAERGIEVDHVTVYRWVQRFTPLFADAARPCRHAAGDRWWVDETYIKLGGRWCYLYRAVDQFGQVIDVLATEKRDAAAARRFFTRALRRVPRPVEVTTDKAAAYLGVLEELLPAARHVTVRQQQGRSRSRPAQGSATPDARAQTPRHRRSDRRRPRPRAEHPPRTLRTRPRRRTRPPAHGSVHRAGQSNLNRRSKGRTARGHTERNTAGSSARSRRRCRRHRGRRRSGPARSWTSTADRRVWLRLWCTARPAPGQAHRRPSR
jgi:IS6 family transposase